MPVDKYRRLRNTVGATTSSSDSSGSTSTTSSGSASTSASSLSTQPLMSEPSTRPPSIVISDEQIDDAPFDPSIPDEVYIQMHHRERETTSQSDSGHAGESSAAVASSSPTSSTTTGTSRHEFRSRFLGRHQRPGAPQRSASAGSVCRLGRFRLWRDASPHSDTGSEARQDDLGQGQTQSRPVARPKSRRRRSTLAALGISPGRGVSRQEDVELGRKKSRSLSPSASP